jgi:hypothetical protein
MQFLSKTQCRKIKPKIHMEATKAPNNQINLEQKEQSFLEAS